MSLERPRRSKHSTLEILHLARMNSRLYPLHQPIMLRKETRNINILHLVGYGAALGLFFYGISKMVGL